MRHRGRHAAVIVAGDDEDAAMRRRSISVTMLQRVAGAVDAGSLAVPEAEYAFDLALWIGLDLLRAEHCGSGKILVHCGKEFDPMLCKKLLGAPEFEVHPAKWRAAIARNEASSFEAVGAIAVALVEQDAHQRLRAGEENAPALPDITIEQCVSVEVARRRRLHGHPPFGRCMSGSNYRPDRVTRFFSFIRARRNLW